jgi:hypothetical protein
MHEKETHMPIIQVEQKQIRTQVKAAIETDVQERLRAYCRFSGATNDQVVSGALKFLFQSDAEFAPWYEVHKNDAQPRRGPRKRIVTGVNQNPITASKK